MILNQTAVLSGNRWLIYTNRFIYANRHTKKNRKPLETQRIIGVSERSGNFQYQAYRRRHHRWVNEYDGSVNNRRGTIGETSQSNGTLPRRRAKRVYLWV
ncbi:hypothetical protein DSM100685_1075 [Bifidobacterium avesanii]|nr:hypothetical protein DSM100685_1075 [Bifidobacterium avesanii]